jgi:hypothetical protein
MPKPKLVAVHNETTLEEMLDLTSPPGISKEEVLRQVRYIDEYVRDPEVKCTVMLVEEHYYDKNYSVEHGAFYSGSLETIPRECRRVHFFSGLTSNELKRSLSSFKRRWRRSNGEKTRMAIASFSRDHYCGFACIRPLRSAPLGFTVLRTFPRAPKQGIVRDFGSTKVYSVTIDQLPFHVEGLCFQQQDAGVAACSSTAIWSSVSKLREHEEIRRATPADISRFALERSFLSGRTMPTPGLRVDQMCGAVHSLDFEPVLANFEGAESLFPAVVHAANRSGIPPILILRNESIGSHAVPVVGTRYNSALAQQSARSGWSDRVSGISSFYVHDDRIGPYVRADLDSSDPTKLALRISRAPRGTDNDTFPHSKRIVSDVYEYWKVRQVLIPTYPRVRQDFVEVAKMAWNMVLPFARSLWSSSRSTKEVRGEATVEFWLQRSAEYQKEQLSKKSFTLRALDLLSHNVVLPRYSYIVRLNFSGEEESYVVDAILDSTATAAAPRYLAVLAGRPTSRAREQTAVGLARELSDARRAIPVFA